MSQRTSIFGSGSAFREVVILVVGILIAFGLDAWWGRQLESNEMRTDLNSVLLELRENRRHVDIYLQYHVRAEAASGALLELLMSVPSGWVTAPDSVVWGTQFTPTFDPRTGALDALLSSGRLAMIEDPQLRGALAGFSGHLTDARDEESRARSYHDLQLAQVLYRSGDVRRATDSFQWRDQGGPPGGADLYTRIETSTELVNHLTRRRLFARLSVESLQAVRDEIDRLTMLIERVLDE